MIEHEDPHDSDTVPLPVAEQEPRRKQPNVTTLLANGLDWLQYDLSQHDQNAVAFFTRVLISLGEIKTSSKYIRWVLVTIAALLLINALGLAEVIYLLGLLIGHVR